MDLSDEVYIVFLKDERIRKDFNCKLRFLYLGLLKDSLESLDALIELKLLKYFVAFLNSVLKLLIVFCYTYCVFFDESFLVKRLHFLSLEF